MNDNQEMEIRKRFSKNIAVLYLSGKINIDSASIIEETGHLIKEGISRVLCNFVNVPMVDYNGLSILGIAYKNITNQKGILKFCNVPKHIKELFKAARLDSVFDIYDDEESALKSFELSSKVDKLSLRRRFKRIDVSIPVKYKTGLSSDTKLLSGKILNMSGEGLFIYAKNTFPVATQIYLEIHLAGEKRTLTLTGIVIWLADKELQPHSYPGMGINFMNLSSDDAEEIIAFIDKNITSRTRAR